jgi:recombination protein RecA
MDARKVAALKEAQRLTEKYGNKAGDTGASEYDLGVTSTGILALDYALGIGGWPEGHPVMVYGPRDIGKSSSVGLAAIREAQRAGKLPGIIALEPGFDKRWAAKHGVDPEILAIARPNSGEEAFAILTEWVEDPAKPDFILFDSLGTIVGESERAKADAAAKVGGASKLITDGTRRVLMPAWKNGKQIMFLNQIRDVIGGPIQGMVKPPGGHALEHHCAIIIQLKPGKDRYTAKIEGEDVQIGQTVVAIVQRNKLSEGSKQRAQFDFYQKEVEGEPFGVDQAADVIATGIKTGVIEKGGAWYRHPSFPDGKLQGKNGVAAFIKANPEVVDTIRAGVLARMFEVQAKAKQKNRPEAVA